jgi:hypothetical protein
MFFLSAIFPLPLRERIENLSEFPFGEIRLDFLGEGVFSNGELPPHQQKLRLSKKAKPKFLQPLPPGERG